MCDPVTAGLILTAASGGASAINNNNALKRQDRQAAAGIRNTAREQTAANQRVNQQIQDIGANTGEAERSAALGDFQNALRTNRGATEGSQQDVAGASDRFAERVGAGREAVRGEGQDQAERLSVIDGILRQRIGEGQDIGRTGADINAIKNNISAEDFLTKLRVAGERPNQLVDFLAGVGKGVGSGMVMGNIKLPGGSVPSGQPMLPGINAPVGSAGAVNPFGAAPVNPFNLSGP